MPFIGALKFDNSGGNLLIYILRIIIIKPVDYRKLGWACTMSSPCDFTYGFNMPGLGVGVNR
jgi:hypothetical protein